MPKRWWKDVAGSAALLSIAAVMTLWLAGGGLRELGAQGGAATSTGRVTGLVASDLLLLQVLLMARIPWVERSYGQDTLARRHRLVGFVSFWLMLAHVVLVTVGYAQSGRTGFLGTAWDLVVTYPGMLLAAAGTALLVLVVVLSIRAARHRQRYETWHLIHLYAYLGVGLALPHQLWAGADFTASAPARVFWWSIYGATLAAVLVFRVGMPVWRSVYHRLRVTAVVPEAPGVVSVHLRGRRLDRLPVRAGQFFLWRFLDGPGWSRANPYTLSAAPRTDQLRITVKDLGDGSGRVASLRPGTRVLIEGPFGVMTAARHRRHKVLLIAAGVGITTMRALLDDLVPAAATTTLLYRIGRHEEPVFQAELDAFARRRGVRVVYLRGSRPARGSWLPAQYAHVAELEALRQLVPDIAEHEAYLCGPPPWMDAARTTLRQAAVPADHIHLEEFAW
ncbi:ferredoxin reductase family protein [Dactylosporangium sp. NPDC049140]|uniref:ferredoxin reductase family protein n=1 Tax=Dactylosporangium sp. NPDC049140 TaxID=3155647 RepID=UPI0033EC5DCD